MSASSSRRERIESMLADDPQDQFLRYSLAMELHKDGQHEESIGLLTGLIADIPPYDAAFFMLAKQLVPLGRIDEARDTLRAGIELARRQGDSHAASEMSEYLTTLGQLGE
jgi:thioredoxin-like negative regulator of GroEL